MPLVPYSAPQMSKPTIPVVNGAHTLAPDMVGCYPCGDRPGAPRDLVAGGATTLTGNAAAPTIEPLGPALHFIASSGYYSGAAPRITGDAAFTLLARMRLMDLGWVAGLCGWGIGSAGERAGFFANLRGAGVISAEYSFLPSQCPATFALGQWATIVYVKRPGPVNTSDRWYMDGRDLGPGVSAGSGTPNIGDTPFTVGAWAGDNSGFIGDLSLVALFRRAALPTEATALSSDPLSIFAPVRRYFAVAATARRSQLGLLGVG